MRLFKSWALAGMILLLLGGWLFQTASWGNQIQPVSAQDELETPTPSPADLIPKRITKITIPYNSYRWWLSRYSNNQIACSFLIEHEGLPTADDIDTYCDTKIYTEWLTSAPCEIGKVSAMNECPGFYLQPISQSNGEREIEIDLPLPSAWISIANCNAQFPDTRCTTLPTMLLTADEPLPNENIISIQGTIAGESFNCMGGSCTVPIKPTGMDGVNVEFWANSSFGDSTEHYTAKVRLIPWGDFMNPENPSGDRASYYVDVLSSRWRDGKLATCSETWQVFPPMGGLPDWLSSPTDAQSLNTDISYYYLAGSLITFGVVDASSCVDGGLQAPNIASPCGVEAARPSLAEWQNRFDNDILQASQDTGVPSRLLKNVFARESQIWPGIFTTYKEAGLGQLTENGTDTVLMWNDDFFHQFCPLVLDKKYCQGRFWDVDEVGQNMLRGALVRKVNASCPDCPAGIDISKAGYSVNVFAEGLLANCEQVTQTIYNVTRLYPGQTSTYEDLWRFTLVNYNAGPGCLYNAVIEAWTTNQPIDWPTISNAMEPVCQSSIGYVEDISRMFRPTPTPTTWLPLGTSQPTPILPRVLTTPTPTPLPFQQSPTPTPTQTITPLPSATQLRTGTVTAEPTQVESPYPY